MALTLLMTWLAPAMVLANTAAAAFLAALPAGAVLPWWVLPLFAAVNAIAHAVPSAPPQVPGAKP